MTKPSDKIKGELRLLMTETEEHVHLNKMFAGKPHTPEELSREQDRIKDKNYPVDFCPICGSDHITMHGTYDMTRIGLDGKRGVTFVQIYCNSCRWGCYIEPTERGRNKFRLRKDSNECKRCMAKEQEYKKVKE